MEINVSRSRIGERIREYVVETTNTERDMRLVNKNNNARSSPLKEAANVSPRREHSQSWSVVFEPMRSVFSK